MERSTQSQKPSTAPTPAVSAQFQSRSFTEPEASQVQTKLEPGPIIGHNFAHIAVSEPTPPKPPKLPPLQRRGLKVGEPNDQYEQEADLVARQVVNKIQRESLEGEEETVIQPKLSYPSGLHRKLVIQRQAIQGGEASEEITREINQAQSGGQSLPKPLRMKMENAFGSDFSGVKVHTDSTSDTLNRSLSSRAFTTGNHIFFKKGEYRPHAHEGQELIAHELTHVVQQGGSSIQRAVPSLVNSTMLQMKRVIVNEKAQNRQVSILPAPLPQKLQAIEGGAKTKVYNRGDIVEISDADTDHIKDETNEIVWYKIKSSNPQYIRATKIYNVSVAPSTQNLEGPEGEELLDSFNEGVIGTTGDSLDEYSKSLKEEDENANTGGIDLTKGVFGTIGGILSMAISIKELVTNKDRKITDWLSAIWDNLTNITNLTSGISQIVSSAKESDQAQSVSDWSGSFGSAMSTLASGIKTIKSVVDLIGMIAGDEKYDKDEYIKAGSEIVGGALETAKGVVESIKSFLEIFNATTASLATAVPALGIAISATQTIVQGYYLAVSAYYWSQMRKESETINQDITQKSSLKANEVKDQYREYNAQITNLEVRKEEKTGKNQVRTAERDVLEQQKKELEAEKLRLNNEQIKLEKEKAKLSKNPDNKKRIKEIDSRLTEIKDRIEGGLFTSGINDLIKRKQKNIEELQKAIDITAPKITQADTKINEVKHAKAGLKISESELEELDLSEELSSGSKKRVIRQSIHISTNAVKIAGNIATLSGAGSVAGITLQATAAGVETSLPFFRALKNYGRNLAAKNQAKGESGISNYIFDANKSTKAKLEARKKNVITIFNMVNGLNVLLAQIPQNPRPGERMAKVKMEENLKRQAARVENYIKAAGCSPKTLYKNNGKPEEQAKTLLQALYQREF